MRAINAERTNQLLPLGAGRVVGFAEYGAAGGVAIFYFHGWPGSRIEAGLLDDAAHAVGARIVAVERPGYGRSTFVRGRKLGSWPLDVHLLANALKIDQFAVLGVSGGGPYALACAAHLNGRVSRTAIVCGVGPLTLSDSSIGMQRIRQIACSLMRRSPGFSRPISYALFRRMRNDADALIEELSHLLPEPDRIILQDSAVREAVASSFQEALAQGVGGPSQDLRIYFDPWDIDFGLIRSSVRFWHGEQDAIIPPRMSRDLAAAIPGAETNFLANDGHYSLPIARKAEILRWVVDGTKPETEGK